MKTFYKLFFALSFVFLLASCSSDDDSGPTGFIDSWKYIGYTENGEYVNDQDECYNEILTINSDNTGNIAIEDCDFGDESYDFTWEENENGTFTLIVGEMGISENVNLTFPEGNDKLFVTVVGDENYSDVYIRQ